MITMINKLAAISFQPSAKLSELQKKINRVIAIPIYREWRSVGDL
jgi:hypothetical protein